MYIYSVEVLSYINKGFESMWVEAAVTWYWTLYRHFPGGTEEYHRKDQTRTAVFKARPLKYKTSVPPWAKLLEENCFLA